MGKGDKKSKKGKIYKGSYGVTRPKKDKNFSIFSGPSISAENQEVKKVKAIVSDDKTTAKKETKKEPKAEVKKDIKKSSKKEA